MCDVTKSACWRLAKLLVEEVTNLCIKVYEIENMNHKTYHAGHHNLLEFIYLVFMRDNMLRPNFV